MLAEVVDNFTQIVGREVYWQCPNPIFHLQISNQAGAPTWIGHYLCAHQLEYHPKRHSVLAYGSNCSIYDFTLELLK